MSILETELTPKVEQQTQEDNVLKPAVEKRHSVMEFYGAGREDWAGADVQQYMNGIRDEWDR